MATRAALTHNQDFRPASPAANAAFTRSADVVQISRPPTRLIVSEPTLAWRDDAVSRLNELIKLPAGWDGYAGEPVSFGDAYYALRVLEAVCADDAPVPYIVPGSSGDLQIEWHLPGGDIELHVRAPNDVVAWHRDSTTGPDGEELVLTNNFVAVVPWIERLAEPSGDRSAAA
jgi:hypothetical protein